MTMIYTMMRTNKNGTVPCNSRFVGAPETLSKLCQEIAGTGWLLLVDCWLRSGQNACLNRCRGAIESSSHSAAPRQKPHDPNLERRTCRACRRLECNHSGQRYTETEGSQTTHCPRWIGSRQL